MDLIGKKAGAATTTTPVKDSHSSRSKKHEALSISENLNPNVSPGPKPSNSPAIKSAKSQKSASKNRNPNPNPVAFSPRNKIRERKFVMVKKKKKNSNNEGLGTRVACKCKDKAGGGDSKKCLCVAYENLRASQEEFFKNRKEVSDLTGSKVVDQAEIELEEEIEKGLMIQDCQIEDGYKGKASEGEVSVQHETGNGEPAEVDPSNCIGSSTVKRRRAKLLEEARNSVPECGKVLHLVKAFEKLLSIPNSKDSDDQKNNHEQEEEEEEEEDKKKAMKWALPGLQPPKALGTQVSSSSFCPSDLFLTSENLGLDPRASVSTSWDSSLGSSSRRNSSGGRRSRRNSSETVSTIGGSRWKKKKVKATSQKPFTLRTEQRGKLKEEEFLKKLQDMMGEEERLRIPIAQGLPWTTDEPECLMKPPTKDITRPIDLKLHSDVRAVERAEFDHQVAEKMTLMELYKMEREREQKMAEEEQIRRLRKELVPKAQPLPYFDRPFMPRRSEKHPTIPREPKFHIPQQKKIRSCQSLSEVSSYTSQH